MAVKPASVWFDKLLYGYITKIFIILRSCITNINICEYSIVLVVFAKKILVSNTRYIIENYLVKPLTE